MLARTQKKKRSATGWSRRGPAGFAATPIAAPVSAARRVAAGRVGGKGVRLGS